MSMSDQGDSVALKDAASVVDADEDCDFGERVDAVSSRIFAMMSSIFEPDVRLQDLGSEVQASSGSRDGYDRQDIVIGERDTWEYTIVWDRSLVPADEGPAIWVVIELERPYGEDWDGEITNVTRVEVAGREETLEKYHLRAVCARSGGFRVKYADRPGSDDARLFLAGAEDDQAEVDTIIGGMESKVGRYVRKFSGAEM